MLRGLRRLVVTTLCLTAVTADAASPAAPIGVSNVVTGKVTRVTRDVVELTNLQRTRNGRSRLRANVRLMRAAQLQAEQMARAGKLAHVLPKAPYPTAKDRLAAAGYRWQTYGENVALGQADAEEAVDGWMRSKGHRKNLLGPDFTELGAGYAVDRKGRPYYVQLFGRPQS